MFSPTQMYSSLKGACASMKSGIDGLADSIYGALNGHPTLAQALVQTHTLPNAQGNQPLLYASMGGDSLQYREGSLEHTAGQGYKPIKHGNHQLGSVKTKILIGLAALLALGTAGGIIYTTQCKPDPALEPTPAPIESPAPTQTPAYTLVPTPPPAPTETQKPTPTQTQNLEDVVHGTHKIMETDGFDYHYKLTATSDRDVFFDYVIKEFPNIGFRAQEDRNWIIELFGTHILKANSTLEADVYFGTSSEGPYILTFYGKDINGNTVIFSYSVSTKEFPKT